MAYYKTRDYNMLNVIRGATKAGVHRDIPKHTDKYACRRNNKMSTLSEYEDYLEEEDIVNVYSEQGEEIETVERILPEKQREDL